MIIQNGTIEIKTKTAMGIDPETGFPVRPSKVSWGEPIPCQYAASKLNLLSKADGEPFTTAKYWVLTEGEPPKAEQLRLRDMEGNLVGEFSVIWAEPLPAVGQTRIWI